MINVVRSQLTQIATFGELVAEKFLILDGDLCGQWFCFENVDVQWRFDSSRCEVHKDGKVIDKLAVFVGETSENSFEIKKAA